MDMEFLSELEDKIGTLVKSLDELKAENASLRVSSEEGMSGLRSENAELKKQLEEIKAEDAARRGRMESAAERVKKLLAKIDSAL